MKGMETIPNTSGFTRIDIGNLLKSHFPKISPFVPRWTIRNLERLLHIGEINDFLEAHFQDDPREFVRQCVLYFELTGTVRGQQYLEDAASNRPVIVANHPLGGPESLVLMDVLASYAPEVRMVTKGIIGEIKPLQPLLVPIPKKHDRSSVERFKTAFASDHPIIIFPAGYCSRVLSNGEIFDFAWHPTFVKMARKFDRPVLPVHISGANSKKFYRISAWRRALHIKTSLESLYLPDEMYKQRGNSLVLTFGHPITPDALVHDIPDNSLADRIRNHVFRLGKMPSACFDCDVEPLLPLT